MNRLSLQRTITVTSTITLAVIHGYKREFSKWDSSGYATEVGMPKVPYCALNIVPANSSVPVNGVVFEVSPSQLDALTRRETGYSLITVPYYDFETDNKRLGECFTFSAFKQDGAYDFLTRTQYDYLLKCISAAREYGPDFLQQFLESTYINEVSLAKSMPTLQS